MSKKRCVVCLLVTLICLTGGAILADNCNCCCKVIDVYGYQPTEPGSQTKCWYVEVGTAHLSGLVVDHGSCISVTYQIKNSGDEVETTNRWEFNNCDLMCVGLNPSGYNDPNPLQESDGPIQANADEAGTMELDGCRPASQEGDPPPTNQCG